MGVACNEWRRVPVLCLTLIFFQTTLSEGAELFDLSELNVSHRTDFGPRLTTGP